MNDRPAATAAARPRRRWARRLVGCGGLGLVTIAALATFLWLTRERILLPIATAEAERAARRAGFVLELGSASGDSERLVLRDVRLRAVEAGALRELHVAELRVTGKFLRLPLRGLAALDAIELAVEKVTVDLAAPPAEQAVPPSAGGAALDLSFLESLPAVDARVLELRLLRGTRELDIAGLHLRLAERPAAGARALHLESAIAGGTLAVHGEIAAGTASATAHLAGIELAQLAVLIPEGNALAGHADLEVDARLPLADLAASEATGRVALRELSAYGFAAETVEGELAWREGVAAVDDLVATQDADELRVEQVRWTILAADGSSALDDPLAALRAGTAEVSGRLSDLPRWFPAAGPLPAHELVVGLRADEGRIEFEIEGELAGGADLAVTASGDWRTAQDLLAAPLALEARVAAADLRALVDALAGPGGGPPVRASGSLQAQLSATGTLAAPLATVSVTAPDLALAVTAAGETTQRIGPAPLVLRARLERDLALEECAYPADERVGPRFALAGKIADVGEAIVGRIGWHEPAIDLRATLEIADVALLDPLLTPLLGAPSPLRAGALRAGGSFAGTLGAPEAGDVELALDAGLLRSSGAFPAITALSLRARLADEVLHIDQARGELGAAPFHCQGEVSGLPPGAGPPAIRLELQGENLLLARSDGLRLRADARLALSGPLERLAAEGALVLRGGRYSIPVEFIDFEGLGSPRATPSAAPSRGLTLFSLPDPPLSTLRFAIDVSAAEPLAIENNVLRAQVRPDLRLSGTGEVPLLDGQIHIDDARVRLPSAELDVESGRITFSENDPFFPTVDAAARTRLRGIDVEIQVSGRYDEPEVLLSSTPPLANEDLLYLLLTGRLPEGSLSRSGAQAAQSVALFLAQDTLKRWLAGDDPGDGESFADRFEFERGRDVSRSGAETMQASFRIDRDVLSDSDLLQLVAERDVFDHVNFGLRLVFRFR